MLQCSSLFSCSYYSLYNGVFKNSAIPNANLTVATEHVTAVLKYGGSPCTSSLRDESGYCAVIQR